MNDNKGIVILKWAVGLLIVCNIALVATMWLRPAPPPRPPHETPRDFVIRNLKFSEAQVKSYDILIAAHQAAMQQLHKDAMDSRQLLFSNLKNENKGGLNTDSLAQVIAACQKEIELVTYRHFAQVRALCTEEQKTEFDSIIGDVMRKMNGGPHGGPPPRETPGPAWPAGRP